MFGLAVITFVIIICLTSSNPIFTSFDNSYALIINKINPQKPACPLIGTYPKNRNSARAEKEGTFLIVVGPSGSAGKKLIEALDREHFELTGALWFYFIDVNEWRLLLVSPMLDRLGPRKSYSKIQSIIRNQMPSFGIRLDTISVISPKDKLINLLKMAIRVDSGISEIRFSNNTINNVFIEDALIYRLT